MLRKKLLKFFYLSFVIIAVFLFFSIGKSPVYATVDLPITSILKGCQPNPNSTLTACLDADPSVGLSWDKKNLNPTLCKGSCTYTVLRNGTNAIVNLDQTQTDWVDLGVNTATGKLKDFTLYKYKIQAYDSDVTTLVAETATEGSITTKVCQCPNNFDLRSASNDCLGTTPSIQITWPRVDVDGWGEAKQYKIFRFTTASETYQNYLLNTNPQSYYVATVLAGNNWIQSGSYYYYNDNKDSTPTNLITMETLYYYRVVAFSESLRAGQASNHSLIRAAGMCPKPQITELATNEPDCSPARITLRWRDCENFSQDECKRRTNYYIVRNGQAVNQFSQPQTTKCFCGGEVKPCCEWQVNALQCCSDDTQSILTNTPYNYSIKTTGNSWELNSDPASKTLTNCIAPTFPAPTSLAVDNTNCQSGSPIMILSWNHSTPDQVAYYYVYKYHCASGDILSCDTVPQATYPRTTSIQTFIDSQNVGLGQWYEYYIVAVSKTNVYSSPSDKIVSQARTNCNTSPPLPHQPVLLVDLQCSADNKPQMYLSWTPVYDDGGRVSGYYVFRDDNNDGFPEKNLTPQGLQQSYYIDTEVSQGQTYSYVIEAHGPGGYIASSSKSATARTDCDKPGPFSLNQPTVSCGGGQYTVNLNWTSSNPAATGYDVFYKLNNATPPTCDTPLLSSNGWLASKDCSQPNCQSYSYSFPNTQAGTYYYFIKAKITGSNKCTLAQNSIQLFGAVPSSPTINETATRAYCDGSVSKIDVAWSAVSNAQSYTLFYCLGSSCTPNIQVPATTNTNVTFSNVGAGQDYTMAVRADGSCENSPLSTSVVRTGSNCPPGGLTLAGSSICQGDNNPAYNLSWSTAPGVGVHYDLYRNGSVLSLSATSPVSDNPGPGTFTYYVKAINTAGSTTSNFYIGNLNCAPPQPFVLNNPQILTCVKGYPVIKLSWSVPTNGASYYKIYRCEGCTDAQLKTSTYLLTGGILTETYGDQGSTTNLLISGHTYRYQVEAVKYGVTTTAFANSAVSATPGLCDMPNLIAGLSWDCPTPAQPRITPNWHWDFAIDTTLLSKYDVFKVTPATNSYNDFSPSPTFANLSPSITQKQDSYPSVQNNISYSYYVKATTISGNSASSNIVSGSADCLPPSGTIDFLQDPSQLCDPWIGIDSKWTYDGTEAVYYKLSKKIGAGSFNEILNTSSKNYTDRAVSPGNSYSYKVAVCKTINNICQESQPRTIPPSGTLPYCPPDKPTDLVLAPHCFGTTSKINLSWQTALNATGYRILRTKVSDGGTTLIQVGNLTSKTDDTPSPSTAYTYQIIAYNSTYDCSNCVGACANQCSDPQSITSNSCNITEPQLFADRCCAGNPGQCTNLGTGAQSNNQYGTHSHLYWQADESSSQASWCKLERWEGGGIGWVQKTPTFHSHAEVSGGAVDNVSSLTAYNSIYGATLANGPAKFPPSAFVQELSGWDKPFYIEIQPSALPEAGKKVMVDFWFNNQGNDFTDNTLRTLLWKRGSSTNPNIRLTYNYAANSGEGAPYEQSLVMSDGKDSYTRSVTLASGLPSSGWHHFIFSQKVNTEAAVYLDKSLVYAGLWQPFGSVPKDTKNYLYLGVDPVDGSSSGGGPYKQGTYTYFDEIKIWPSVISSRRQVQKLYDNYGPALSALSDLSMITVGTWHTCALKTGGTVWCWGRNGFGQLGNGTTTDSPNQPVQVTGLTGASFIAAGEYHTCAISGAANEVWCWGRGVSGQMGNGSTNSSNSSPVKVQKSTGGDLNNVTKLSASYNHTCAIDANKDLWCWGLNNCYQASMTSSASDVLSALKIASAAGKSTGISAGYNVTCVMDNYENPVGTLAPRAGCWGDKGNTMGGSTGLGKLGNNNWQSGCSYSGSYLLTPASTWVTGIKEINVGRDHGCLYRLAETTPVCWGKNVDYNNTYYNQNGAECRYSTLGLANCAFSYWTWGECRDNCGGEAKNNIAMANTVKKYDGTNLNNVRANNGFATGGADHTCIIANDNTAWCWGSNVYGQCGQDMFISKKLPRAAQVLGPDMVTPLANIKQMSAGERNTCAVLENGTAYCWGDNTFGQLGNPEIPAGTGNVSDFPVLVSQFKKYDTLYDDFDTNQAGLYQYKVTCGYADGTATSTQATFNFTACPPDIDFPTDNSDLSRVCSELTAKNQQAENPDIEDCSGDGFLVPEDPWPSGGLSGWDKRMKLTIDKNDINSDLTDFPALIHLSNSSGRGNDDVTAVFDEIGANSKKIAVTASDKITQLYVEIEKWDSVGEEAWLWVRVPDISSSVDADLYLYYDNNQADNTTYIGDKQSSAGQNVWGSSFGGVQHFDENSGTLYDSTLNNMDMIYNSSPTYAADAEIYKGIRYASEGSANRIYTNAAFDTQANNWTLEFWANYTQIADYQTIVWYQADINANYRELITVDSSSNIMIWWQNGPNGTDTNVDMAWGAWHHWGFRYDDTAQKLYIYKDGVLQNPGGFSADLGNAGNQTRWAHFNRYDATTQGGSGTLDEWRFSATLLSEAYIKASYETGRDDLIDFSNEEMAAAGEAVGYGGLEPSHQVEAPYVLLNWDYFSGAETLKVYKYQHKTNPAEEDKANATLLATFSTNSADTNYINCQNNQCKCKDRSAEEKEAGLYKKFHYFIKAEGPTGSSEKEFPSSASGSTPGYGLSCSTFNYNNPIYLSSTCDKSSPGVQIFLKDSISANITSYWNGKSDKLTLAGGNSTVTPVGNVVLGGVPGIASDAGGATHLDQPATSVSWAALGNSNDTAIAANPSIPYSVSMWLKFDNLTAPSSKEIFFINKIPSQLISYLVLTREPSGQLGIYTKSTTGDIPTRSAFSSNSVADTNWHHIKASWLKKQTDGTKEMRLWYDFNLVASSDVTTSTLVLDSPALRTITLGSTVPGYLTAKTAVDEVYLTQNTPDNDPYYYEIFRKGPSDSKYKYITTLDSNAYLYLENIKSNNGLIGGEAYSYKVKIVPTNPNQPPILRDLEGVLVESDCLSVSANSECDDMTGSVKVSLTWDDSIKPNASNKYQILIKKSSDFIWWLPDELSAYQSTPDDTGSYCEAVSEGSSVLRCYYNFWVSGLTSYDFQIQRYLESGESGYQATVPTLKSSAQSTVLTTKCYNQDPTPFHIKQLGPCCYDGGSCLVSGLGKPAVSVRWYDADYAYRYKIYRDCLSDLSDCEAHGVWVADYSSSLDDVCTNNGNQCLSDAACSPGGTCGPETYSYLDLGVGFGESHTYRVFAIGRKVEADDPPALPITTPESGSGAPESGSGGCLLKPLQPTITNISRTCIGASPTHQISWIPPTDPNFTLEKWQIFVGEAPLGGSTAYSIFKLKSLVAATLPPTLSYGGGNLFVNNIYNYQIVAQATDGTLSDPSDPWPEDQITPVCVWPPRKDLINLHLSNYSDCHKITFAFDIKDPISGHADDWAEGYEIYRLTSDPTNLIADKYYYCNCGYNSGVLGCQYSGGCPTNDKAYYKNKKLSDLGNTPFSSIYPSRNAASYTFEDTGFHPGYIYYWAVDSYNTRGYSTSTAENIFGLSKFCKGTNDEDDIGNSCTDNSQCSSNVCSVGFPTKECAQPPAKSTVTAASECPDKVKLSWPNPADTTVTHYKIYRRGLEESDFILLGICGEGTKKGMGCVSNVDCRDLTHSDVICDTNPLLACVNPQGGSTGCFNAFVDAPGALTAIYKYSIVSVAKQDIEIVIEGAPTIKSFYVEGDSVEKNARACFKLPRWQELPGVTP